jgi:hypothetical protein
VRLVCFAPVGRRRSVPGLDRRMVEVAIGSLAARGTLYSPFVRYVKNYIETVLKKLKASLRRLSVQTANSLAVKRRRTDGGRGKGGRTTTRTYVAVGRLVRTLAATSRAIEFLAQRWAYNPVAFLAPYPRATNLAFERKDWRGAYANQRSFFLGLPNHV